MFICIAGKNDIAVDVTRYILELDLDINIGVTFNKTETGVNSWQRSFKKYAISMGLKEYSLEEIYDIEDVVFISLEYDRIVKPEKFKNARLFNIHFSLLPAYKGMYTSAIPILNNETTVGVTFHRIDKGIDTGDIISQVSFEIGDISSRELYSQYIKYGTKLVIDNLRAIIEHKEISYPQNSIGSTYYSRKYIDYSNIAIDLNQTAYYIHKQLQAFNFREYQLPAIDGTAIIADTITTTKSTNKPGEILFENASSMVISTVDYNIVCFKDRLAQLLQACETNNVEITKEICCVKAHINAQETEHGWSPLMVATYFNSVDVVNVLISLGADINQCNYNGTNLLMYAKEAYIRYGDSQLFKMYKRLGLREDQSDYSGHDLFYYLEKDGIQIKELV